MSFPKISWFLLLLSLGFPTLLVAQTLTSESRLKVDPDLLTMMEEEHFAAKAAGERPPVYRIVVDLRPEESGEDLTKAFATKASEDTLRGNIRRTQDRVLGTLASKNHSGYFQVWNRYRSTYGFSAYADAESIAALAAHKDVGYVYEMPVYQLTDAQAHALTNTDNAHNAGFTGNGTTIAIIDDGIDHNNAAFGGQNAWPNDKILGGRDFADNDNNPRVDCNNQTHGTSVAGVAAGNGGGVVGTAPDANIVFLKVQSAGLCGTPWIDGDIPAAIDWAVDNRNNFDPPIRIISMSFGGGSNTAACPNIPENNALVAARNAGMLVFASSGNDANSNGMGSPACHPDALSVGATYDANVGSRNYFPCSDSTTAADQITCYSNSDTFLDFLAPAHCALTAATNAANNTCFGGTSSATPYIAGAAATLYSKNHGLTRNTAIFALDWGGDNITDGRNGVTTPRVDTNGALGSITGRYLKYPSPRVNGQLVGARGTPVSGGTIWSLSTPAETATRFCQDRGLPRHDTYQSSIRGSAYSYVNGQNGNGSWSVTGNSGVTMLDQINCRSSHNIVTTNYSTPKIFGQRVGRSTSSSISREETAKQFCIYNGHEPGYISWNITYPTGSTYTHWTGSSWSVTGNSSVELFTSINCADI